ncbi:DUF5924 family protein [Zestomonas carbonaria]|uniref:DUF2914 domain-containing protein n=1 Tax=Zestomonas carbonaria TaxID=2762745 RepID=A0A7U7EJX2_9GAMM|nr:DUF5924 family protein [Pseudomonas carbonaria]CAD5106383.1 hypothetical protein PSEWESI4_00644 [Pseudomonas carbonaria]
MIPPLWKVHIARLIALLQRYPGVVAAFGFASGVASFVLVDRHSRSATVMAVIMLASWLWLVLEGLFTRVLARLIRREIPQPLLRYGTQMIHQESLFFVLPFFFFTTTWNSGQALFTGLLGLGALVSIIDPLYFKGLVPRRWLYLALHTLTLFAVVLTALPVILHLTTAESYKLALGVAVALSFPSLLATFPVQRWWRGLALIALTLALGGAGWLLRSWVPPATLWLTEVAVTNQLDNRNRAPGESLREIDVARLRAQGLYAYTAISAPRGLDERIYHVWRKDGQEVDRIALDIRGGRKAGYRAWTHKRNFPAQPAGDWQVRVITENDQLIGVLRFKVVEKSEARDSRERSGKAPALPPSPAPHPSPLPEGEGTGRSGGHAPESSPDEAPALPPASALHPSPLPEGEGTGRSGGHASESSPDEIRDAE